MSKMVFIIANDNVRFTAEPGRLKIVISTYIAAAINLNPPK